MQDARPHLYLVSVILKISCASRPTNVPELSMGGSEGWGWWLTGRSTATRGPECVCVSVSVLKESQTAPFPDHLHNIAGHAKSRW